VPGLFVISAEPPQRVTGGNKRVSYPLRRAACDATEHNGSLGGDSAALTGEGGRRPRTTEANEHEGAQKQSDPVALRCDYTPRGWRLAAAAAAGRYNDPPRPCIGINIAPPFEPEAQQCRELLKLPVRRPS
jgi:hypothetical protein